VSWFSSWTDRRNTRAGTQ